MNLIIKQKYINIEDLHFCSKVDKPLTLTGTLVILFISLWRGQFTLICKEQGRKETVIQTFATAKLQSRLLNVIQPIRKLLALIAIKSTLMYDARSYVDSTDRAGFIENKIGKIIENGPAKILSSSEVDTEEDIAITRRGVVARLKGNIQATSMFNATSLVTGMNLAKIGFKDFTKAYISYMKFIMNMEVDELIEILYKVCNDCSAINSNIWEKLTNEVDKVAYLAKVIIYEFLFEWNPPLLPDGIKLNDKSNLIPIEEELYLTEGKSDEKHSTTSFYKIKRPLPKNFERIFDVEESDDPIIQEILNKTNKVIQEQNEKAKITSKRRRKTNV